MRHKIGLPLNEQLGKLVTRQPIKLTTSKKFEWRHTLSSKMDAVRFEAEYFFVNVA